MRILEIKELIEDSVKFISQSAENTEIILKNLEEKQYNTALYYIENIKTTTRASSIIKQHVYALIQYVEEQCIGYDDVLDDSEPKMISADVLEQWQETFTGSQESLSDLASELGIYTRVTKEEIEYVEDLHWMKEGTLIKKDKDGNIVEFNATEYLGEYPELEKSMDIDGYVSINLI